MKNKKPWFVFWAVLTGVMVTTNLAAADFLLSWSAGTDPSVTAYGIYQRSGDSAYEKIQEVSVQDLEDPVNPSCLVTGLTDGNTYWFAVTAISGSGAESEFFDQTCITVNGRIVECTDDDDNGSTVFISCFITAAGF